MKQKRFTLRRLAAPLAIVAALLLSAFPARAWKETELLRLKEISMQGGDTITSFDITFTFDLSNIIAAYGDKEWGICCVSNLFSVRISSTQSPDFYTLDAKGFPTNGKDESFEVGNSLTFHFEEGRFPRENISYMYQIGAHFRVYEKGSSSACDNSNLTFGGNFASTDNMKFTVYGGKTDHLFYGSCPIEDKLIDSLSETTLTFTQPVKIADGAKVHIMKRGLVGQNKIWTPYIDEQTPICEATAIALNAEDPTQVMLTFPETEFLRGSGNYMICWEKGTFVHAATDEPCNEFYVSFQGSKDTKYTFLRATDNRDTFDYITLSFLLPEGFSFGSINQTDAVEVYEGSDITPEALVTKRIRVMAVEGAPASLRVPLWFAKQPETKYTILIPAGTILLYDADGNQSSLYSNALVRAQFTTAPRDKVGVPPIVWDPNPFDNTYNYKNPKVIDPESVEELKAFVVALTPFRPVWNGMTFDLAERDDTDNSHKASLYEVTDTGDILLSDNFTITANTYSGMTEDYQMARVYLGRKFYDGHTYKIVIPAGIFTLYNKKGLENSGKQYYNYALSPEFSYTFKGATDPTVSLLETSLEEGKEYESVEKCLFTFSGKQTFAASAPKLVVEAGMIPEVDGEEAIQKAYSLNVIETLSFPLSITYSDAEKTVVTADLRVAGASGKEPLVLKPGFVYRLTIPEGTFAAAAPELSVPEFSLSLLAPPYEELPDDPKQDGIESISADGTVEVWNLQGVSLGFRPAALLNELPSGCYIVRAGAKTVKVRLK